MPLDVPPNSPRLRQEFSVFSDLRILLATLLKIPRGMLRVVQRQFDLRTLFLFVFVIALGGAWIAHEQHESERQLALASELEELDGIKVQLAKRFCTSDLLDCTPDNSWWQEMLGDLCGERIVSVRIRSTMTDRTYELLAQLPRLNRLSLIQLKNLRFQKLPQAKFLWLGECYEIDRDQLQYLNRFDEVVFYDCAIAYEDFAALQRWRPGCFFMQDPD